MTPDPDPDRLRSALHDRVATEHVDLDRLTSVATRGGLRMRRRRRLAVSLGAVAAVGSIATGTAAVLPLVSGPSSTGEDPGFAGSPTASAPSPSATAGTAGPVPTPAPSVTPGRFPVRVELRGWKCTAPADEKFTCTDGRAVLSVHLRRAADRDAWITDPDKGAAESVYTSDVHGDWFASITMQQGATPADLSAVAGALVWTVD